MIVIRSLVWQTAQKQSHELAISGLAAPEIGHGLALNKHKFTDNSWLTTSLQQLSTLATSQVGAGQASVSMYALAAMSIRSVMVSKTCEAIDSCSRLVPKLMEGLQS